MFVLHKALNGRHLATDFFHRGEEQKRRRLVEEEVQAGKETPITAYGIPLTPVTSFKYLGRILSTLGDEWPAGVHNLRQT